MTTSTAIARLNAADPDFAHHLDHLLSWESVSDDSVNQRVLDIIKAVRERGDAALVDFTRQFDGLDVKSMADLILPRERLELALTRITAPQREALEVAAARVRSYHEKQKPDSWSYTEADGTVLGQKVTPLDRAGLYVPGGKASYPSSVLMNAIPAKVAGVTEVEARRLAVVSAQSALDASQVGLEVGTRTVLDVLQNQRTLFQAQVDYSEAKYRFLQNRLLLEQAAGTLDGTDVQDINRLLTADAESRLSSQPVSQ